VPFSLVFFQIVVRQICFHAKQVARLWPSAASQTAACHAALPNTESPSTRAVVIRRPRPLRSGRLRRPAWFERPPRRARPPLFEAPDPWPHPSGR
jgi:hypothetical protein